MDKSQIHMLNFMGTASLPSPIPPSQELGYSPRHLSCFYKTKTHLIWTSSLLQNSTQRSSVHFHWMKEEKVNATWRLLHFSPVRLTVPAIFTSWVFVPCVPELVCLPSHCPSGAIHRFRVSEHLITWQTVLHSLYHGEWLRLFLCKLSLRAVALNPPPPPFCPNFSGW